MDMRAARRVLGWEPDTFYLLQLGRMVPRKGIDNVIRALARLRRSYGVNARLCVVGGDLVGGTDIDELQRLVRVAEEERVADYVEFTGSRARDVLSRYYSAADVRAVRHYADRSHGLPASRGGVGDRRHQDSAGIQLSF